MWHSDESPCRTSQEQNGEVVRAMPRPTARGGAGVAAVLAAALTVASCSSAGGVDAQGPVTHAPTMTPMTTSNTRDPGPSSFPSATDAGPPESADILNQYRAFFASLTPLSKDTYAARFAAMQKLAADPELTKVMGGMAASTKAGEVFYGEDVVRPMIVSVVGDVATIADCQDTSNHGREKSATGEKVTVGVKNTLANVTMTRGADGVWRVATVENQQAGSCAASA